MSDDKPKHKPQQKHTLSEVLKSLQDLIRTDLVAAPPTASPAPAAVPPRIETSPPTPAEPDSFNDALDKLDEIITHNIIEPVERAKETPPEALLPEETLEIEWDDFEPPPPAKGSTTVDSPAAVPPPAFSDASEDTIELADEEPPAQERQEPRTNVVELEIIQIETDSDRPSETIDLDTPPAESQGKDNVIDFDSGADDTEVIELTSLTDDVAPDTVELPPESLADLPATQTNQEPAPAKPPAPAPAATAPPANPQRELFETYVAPPEPLDAPNRSTPPAAANEPKPSRPSSETAAAPPPPSPPKETAANASLPAPPTAERRDTAPSTGDDTQAERGQDIPSLAIDFDVTQLSATLDDATAAKTFADKEPPPAQERTLPERAAPAATAPAKTRERAAQAPVAPKPPAPAKEARGTPAATKSAAVQPPAKAPVQEDIPVLKEVADLDAPPAAPLPSAAQARDIAIRVIAKLNIERRKAGEAGLDIKTIEKLQQYLADALNKRTINKPK